MKLNSKNVYTIEDKIHQLQRTIGQNIQNVLVYIIIKSQIS